MFGIDDPSAVASLPTPEAAGTVGFWTEGNPGTGTPATLMRASFFNGLQQELLNILSAAGITPSKTTYNQLLAAIKVVAGGRLLNIQLITSTQTYTPTTGTKNCLVRAVGGGGGAGGAVSTATGNIACGLGGNGGSYAEGYYPVASLTGQTMTIGAAGAGVVNGQGTAGGTTSFGAVLNVPGGSGGVAGANTTPPWLLGETGNGSTPTGGNIANIAGQSGQGSFAMSTGAFVSGRGGSSPFGVGGNARGTVRGNGAAAQGFGGGGGGAVEASAGAGGLSGGAGTAGCIVIYEYA